MSNTLQSDGLEKLHKDSHDLHTLLMQAEASLNRELMDFYKSCREGKDIQAVMARVEHSIAEVRRIKAAWLVKYHEDQQAHYVNYKSHVPAQVNATQD